MGAANNRVILLGRLLKRVDNFDVASFKDRLIFQKTVYLLQAKGVFLGYSFNWYLHGPYSPVLARDGFELGSIYEQLQPYTFRDKDTEAAFRDFSVFLGDNGKNANWLEAAASIHFLRKSFPHEAKQDTIERVKAKGAHLSAKICADAWKALEQAAFLR